MGQATGLWLHGKEPFDFIKGEKSFEKLSDYQFLQNSSAA
jgi:hypothetical protein